MLKLALITGCFIAVAMLLLCIKILIVPGGKFGSQHIGGSAEMRRRGIHCVQSMDAMERKENVHRVSERHQEKD